MTIMTGIDKNGCQSAMECSSIKDVEIKYLWNNALNGEINERKVFVKGIEVSYYYEGYDEYDIHIWYNC